MEYEFGVTELQLDFREVCRMCLNQSENLKSIFCHEIIDSEIIPFPNVCLDVLGVQIDKGSKLPHLICLSCRNLVKQFFLFRAKFRKAQSLLCHLLKEANTLEKRDQESQTDFLLVEDISEYEEEQQKETTVVGPTVDLLALLNSSSSEAEGEEDEEERKDNQALLMVESEPESLPLQTSNFVCFICQTIIKNPAKVRSHLEAHKRCVATIFNSVEFFCCRHCHRVYVNSDDLHEHLSAMADCYPPNDVGATTDPLVEDVLTDVSTRLMDYDPPFIDYYCCNLCSARFQELLQLHQHRLEAHVDTEIQEQLIGPFRCGECGHVEPTAKAIKRHLFTHGTVFSCPFVGCGNEYESIQKLGYHIDRRHLEKPLIACIHCSETFETQVALNRHTRRTCPKRTETCLTCHKKFFDEAALKIHERTHKEKLVKCPEPGCDRGFSRLGNLTTHLRLHNGSKPYKCTYVGCEKRFRTVGHRNDHMPSHSEERNFQCEICSSRFKSARILKGHVKTQHEQGRVFKCPVEECGKTFSRAYHVKVHQKIHKNQKAAPVVMEN